MDADNRLPARGELNTRGSSAANRQITRATVNRPQVERVDDFLDLPGRTAGVRGSSAGRASANAQLVSHRTSWSTNVRAAQLTRVNNNLRQANLSPVRSAVSTRNWLSANPARAQHWNGWAGGIRHHWQPHSYHHCFTPRWWAVNNVFFPWRHNYYWWGARPWSYWWSSPSWNTCAAWYSGWGWNTPYYYDYGYGGNVVYVDRYVYVNGQPVGTSTEYAQSAAALAATEPSPEVADQPGEWMALGTFAIATSKEETDPARVIQLAVDKEGNVSGTMVNKTTNKTYPVQGHVDKETQRVAFTIGDNKDVVLETGLYNLTQQETPVLVHQGTDRTETYVMLRVEAPQDVEKAENGSQGNLLP